MRIWRLFPLKCASQQFICALLHNGSTEPSAVHTMHTHMLDSCSANSFDTTVLHFYGYRWDIWCAFNSKPLCFVLCNRKKPIACHIRCVKLVWWWCHCLLRLKRHTDDHAAAAAAAADMSAFFTFEWQSLCTIFVYLSIVNCRCDPQSNYFIWTDIIFNSGAQIGVFCFCFSIGFHLHTVDYESFITIDKNAAVLITQSNSMRDDCDDCPFSSQIKTKEFHIQIMST